MNGFIDIAALADIPRQGARLVKTAFGCIAVFRTADDQVFALDDRCPHKGGPLSEGIVHGTFVTCPLHALVFDLSTGLAQGPDAGAADPGYALHAYAVRSVNGRVFLNADPAAHPNAAHPAAAHPCKA